MKLVAIVLLFSTSVMAQNNLRLSNRVLSGRFIETKVGFRHLRLKNLPQRNGKIDNRKLLLLNSQNIKVESFGLDKSLREELQKIVVLCAKNTTSPMKVMPSIKRFVQRLENKSLPIDLNKLISYIIRESVLNNNKDLLFYAEKVKHFNDQKETIREHIQTMREHQNKCIQGGVSCSQTTKMRMNQYIESLEDELATVGDDAQLANIDLQNVLQKQQQTMQIMSNISKVMHDTIMAIIRNLRA